MLLFSSMNLIFRYLYALLFTKQSYICFEILSLSVFAQKISAEIGTNLKLSHFPVNFSQLLFNIGP